MWRGWSDIPSVVEYYAIGCEFDKVRRLKSAEDGGRVRRKEINQRVISDIAGGDQKELRRTPGQNVGIHEAGILCDNDALLAIRESRISLSVVRLAAGRSSV
jgi:hypothetical protein